MYEREARRTHCLHVGLVEASQERRQQKSQPFLIMSRVASHASRGDLTTSVSRKRLHNTCSK